MLDYNGKFKRGSKMKEINDILLELSKLQAENEKLKLENEKLKKIQKERRFEDLGFIKIKVDENGDRTDDIFCPRCDTIMNNPEKIIKQYNKPVEQIPDIYCFNCKYHISSRKIITILKEWDNKYMS